MNKKNHSTNNEDYFVHPNALIEDGVEIGQKTQIWAFTHILSGAVIGRNCNINDYVFIERDVVIGDSVTIKCGVQIWDGVSLEDNVFIGPNATFTNDPFPRSKQYPDKFSKTIVQRDASIGANVTILPGIIIGANAMVGAGSVVTRDVPPNAIVMGNPARITGYVDSKSGGRGSLFQRVADTYSEFKVSGVKLIELPLIVDLRGSLSFGEYATHLPFEPKRYFIIFDVPTSEVRGEHAHRELHQFLICVKGSCSVVVDDGSYREEVVLCQPNIGLYLPPMIWGIQYKYTADAVLLVLTSDIYKAEDYIRNYSGYLDSIRKI